MSAVCIFPPLLISHARFHAYETKSMERKQAIQILVGRGTGGSIRIATTRTVPHASYFEHEAMFNGNVQV